MFWLVFVYVICCTLVACFGWFLCTLYVVHWLHVLVGFCVRYMLYIGCMFWLVWFIVLLLFVIYFD